MSSLPAGWYKDPADTSTQRYWDGEGWLGAAIPADAVPPDGPPPIEREPTTAAGPQAEGQPGFPPGSPQQPGWGNAPGSPQQPGWGNAPGSPQAPDSAQAPDPTQAPGWGPQPGAGQQQAPPGWGPQQGPPAGWGPQPGGPPVGWGPQPGQQPGWGPQGQQGPPTPGWAQPPPGWGQPPVPPPGWRPVPGMPMAYLYPVQARPHGFPLAGFGPRLVARLIDIIAVLLLNIVVNGYFAYQWLQEFLPIYRETTQQVAAGGSAFRLQSSTPRMEGLLWAMLITCTLLWLAYEAPAIANGGQTLGKRLMRIKVVAVESTEPLGFARAFGRWARLGLWTPAWGCFGFGFLMQLIDAVSPTFDPMLRQAFHDKRARTVVVALPPSNWQPADLNADPDGSTTSTRRNEGS